MYGLLSSLKEKDNAYVAGGNWCVAACYTGAFLNRVPLKAEIGALMKREAELRADPQLLQNFSVNSSLLFPVLPS